MKNNWNKKLTKEHKNMLSPTNKNYKNTFNKNLFKNEINKSALSQKKSKKHLSPLKKKNASNKYHRRTKSNTQNYIENMENNIGINSSVYQLSFITEKKENEKEKEIKNNHINKSAISRNKKINQYKRMGNILSISFSLKDISNNIIESSSPHKNVNFSKNNQNSSSKYYNNDTNLKTNKSVYFFDNTTNIEETRNTTSNTNFIQINNSNLLYNKHLNNENNEKEKQNSNKYINRNKKQKRKLYSSMDHKSKYNYTNANDVIIQEKVKSKYNLHRFIYNNNNIKPKNSIKTNNNYIHYLNSVKKSFKSSENKFSNINKYKNLYINPIYESYYDEPLSYYKLEKEKENNNINSSKTFKKTTKFFNKNNFPSSTTNKNGIKKIIIPKNKKRSNKSQENYYKLKIKEVEPNKEFDSVEEIHFMFVQINQSKKSFFNKYDLK